MNKIYLDYNATAPLKKPIADYMYNMAGIAFNASSIHAMGREAKKLLEQARVKIANSLKIKTIDDYRIIFTASGTEANNLALHYFKDYSVIAASTDHTSVLKSATESKNFYSLRVNKNGIVDLEHLQQLLQQIAGPKLVSVMLANNETGIIQDIKQIAAITHDYGGILHSDAVQALGKIDIDINELAVDMLTLSAHKCGGPIGAACLVSKKNIPLSPLIKGGGQEQSFRAGTENITAIIGFGMAAELASDNIAQLALVKNLRDEMEQRLKNYCYVIGGDTARLPNTSCIIMPGVTSETQLINFDLAGFCLSAGSACSSGKVAVSHVLTSMGYATNEAACAIRVSMGVETAKHEVALFVNKWHEIYHRLTENFKTKLSA